MLSDIEKFIEKELNIPQIEISLKEGLHSLLNEEEIKEELEKMVLGNNYSAEFAGITVHLLNSHKRRPFYRARLNLIRKNDNKIIAWYEQEYGEGGEVLDDFFDFEDNLT
jgi:hypothetical protein